MERNLQTWMGFTMHRSVCHRSTYEAPGEAVFVLCNSGFNCGFALRWDFQAYSLAMLTPPCTRHTTMNTRDTHRTHRTHTAASVHNKVVTQHTTMATRHHTQDTPHNTKHTTHDTHETHTTQSTQHTHETHNTHDTHRTLGTCNNTAHDTRPWIIQSPHLNLRTYASDLDLGHYVATASDHWPRLTCRAGKGACATYRESESESKRPLVGTKQQSRRRKEEPCLVHIVPLLYARRVGSRLRNPLVPPC